MILAGIASAVFGLLLFLFRGAGALSIVWLIGAYSIAFRVLLIALTFLLRGIQGGEMVTARG